MYRILAENRAVRERRAQRSHPNHPKPEVVARAPNEVWSWDITRLLGPEKWRYFHLYVILDIFSRYVTGWMVAERETAGLAGHLVGETCLKQGVRPRVLTPHSDRGSPMTAKCTAQLLADLGVTQSLGRPGSRTTTRTRRRTSRPSSTTPASPAGSAASRRQWTSAGSSSGGTTPSTGTAASACSPPSRSTSAAPPRSSGAGGTCSLRPTTPGPTASWAARRGPRNFRRRLDQPRTPRHGGRWSRARQRGKGGATKLNRQVSQSRWQVPLVDSSICPVLLRDLGSGERWACEPTETQPSPRRNALGTPPGGN